MAFDIVIVGGGLSGLALAAELAQVAFSKLRVLVLEQRQSYARDRTWSYWKTPQSPAHRYSHLERQHWSQWRVQQGERIHKHGAPVLANDGKTASYCTVDGDAFYSSARQAISQSSHVEVRLGTSVREISGGETPNVVTREGEVIPASWVFDARPPVKSSEGSLVQQFLGYEIKTDYDVFDADTVDLMHFMPSTVGLHFFYVLPYSPRNALIETTWISPDSLKPDFESELRQFIATLVGPADYKVQYEEMGSLNLNPGRDASNHAMHLATLGRGAGTLRASTGYAFLETLTHTLDITASLEKQIVSGDLSAWLPPAFKRSALDQWMDTVFLKVLARDWSKGSEYFMQLFERVDADTMVAFMSGRASWQQRLSIAAALPSQPFAAQALSTWINRAPGFGKAKR